MKLDYVRSGAWSREAEAMRPRAVLIPRQLRKERVKKLMIAPRVKRKRLDDNWAFYMYTKEAKESRTEVGRVSAWFGRLEAILGGLRPESR